MARQTEKPLAPDIRGNYFIVDSRRLIEEEGFNRREDYGNLEELAAQIKAEGLEVLDPLWCVKKGEYYAVRKGHRRRRALKILEQEGEILMVRILMVPKNYSEEMLLLDQVTGNEGKPFTPWEKCKVVRDLRGKGWSPKDIVERSGLSAVYVRRLLSLADAPQRLINLVREGKVAATFAMDTIANGPEQTEALIATAEAGVLPAPNLNSELFPTPEAPPRPHRTTESDIKPNSWKIFKHWSKTIDEEKLSEEGLERLAFLRKIQAGEVTEKEYKKFIR